MLSASSRNRASLSRSAASPAATTASARLRSVMSSATTLTPTMAPPLPFRGYQLVSHACSTFLSVGPLPVDLDPGDRLTGAQDRLDDDFHLVCDLRDRFTHRPPDVIGDGNAADLRQSLVDLHVAAVRRKECKPHRRSIVDQLELRQLLEGLVARRRNHMPPSWRPHARPRSPPSTRLCNARILAEQSGPRIRKILRRLEWHGMAGMLFYPGPAPNNDIAKNSREQGYPNRRLQREIAYTFG